MMIAFDTPVGHFQARTAAICIQHASVLIHRDRRMAQWSLPGGRIEMGEASADALVREVSEELNTHCHIERLAMVVEVLSQQGTTSPNWYHQIGWYYLVAMPDFAYTTERFSGLAEAANAEFWWCPIAQVSEVPLYPQALKQWLAHPAHTPQYVVESQVYRDGIISVQQVQGLE